MTSNSDNPKTNFSFKNYSFLRILELVVLLTLVLHFGKPLFLPLGFSALLSMILYPICKWLVEKGIPNLIAIIISLVGTLLSLALFIFLLINQFIKFSKQWRLLRFKLNEALNQFSVFLVDQFGLSSEKQQEILRSTFDNSGTNILEILKDTLFGFTDYFYYLLVIPIFTLLILYYRKLLVRVLFEIFSNEKKDTILEILEETIHTYYEFIKGMLFVYLTVGVLNSIGLAIIGIPHPILFGFLAAILTFIPYFGIMISSLLPITVSWITYNSIWYPLGVIVVFSIVQTLEAYVIFPIIVGNRLKINTLMIIIVIITGGLLWGAAGMILFIPALSILKLVADRTYKLKIISTILEDNNS